MCLTKVYIFEKKRTMQSPCPYGTSDNLQIETFGVDGVHAPTDTNKTLYNTLHNANIRISAKRNKDSAEAKNARTDSCKHKDCFMSTQVCRFCGQRGKRQTNL